MTTHDPIQSPHAANSPDEILAVAESLSAQLDFAAAVDLLQNALPRWPCNLPLLSALANAIVNARHPLDSLPYFDRAFALAPHDPRLHNNHGLALSYIGRFDDAHCAFANALRLDPAFVPAHNNLANLYIMMGRHHDALTSLEIALLLDPEHASAQRNRGIAYLSLGNFDAGRDDYDRACTSFPDTPLPCPLWAGEPLAGRRLLLLTTRHGLGDTVQFIRYAPQLKALGAHVILQCAMPIAEIIRSAPGIDELLIHTDPLPPADYCLQLISLLRLFKTSLANIPAGIPYLTPPPQRVAAWQEWFATQRKPDHLLVGIAWQGNPHHQWDQFRSAPLAEFAPLAKLPGVQLVSLQRGPGTEQIPAFQHAMPNALLVPTEGEQTNPAHLADAAAIIATLDLLVTVDTFTAHLAGAMGKPIYVALSTVADWRWMTDRPDTPWYPTMQLFRQRTPNDWPELFSRIAASLHAREFLNSSPK